MPIRQPTIFIQNYQKFCLIAWPNRNSAVYLKKKSGPTVKPGLALSTASEAADRK